MRQKAVIRTFKVFLLSIALLEIRKFFEIIN